MSISRSCVCSGYLTLRLVYSRASRLDAGLLNHVRQLMGEQFLSRSRTRRILTRTEHNILARSICHGVHRMGGIRRLGIRMNPHVAEIMAEPRLEEGARRPVQWLT